MSITRTELIEPPLVVDKIELPNGKQAYIRKLTEEELIEHESGLFDAKGKVSDDGLKSQRRRFLALSICDENGQRMFDACEADLLRGMHGDIATAIHEAAQALSVKKPKEKVEDLEKKSEEATG